MFTVCIFKDLQPFIFLWFEDDDNRNYYYCKYDLIDFEKKRFIGVSMLPCLVQGYNAQKTKLKVWVIIIFKTKKKRPI
jgi:hypothetical protein